MKRLIFWFTLLLSVTTSATFLRGHPALAADDVAITLHHEPGNISSTSGRGQPAAQFAVYDLTAASAKARADGETIADIGKKLAAKDVAAMQEYITANNLTRITTLTTNSAGAATFTVPNTGAYVVVQETTGDDPQNALEATEMSQPITFSLPVASSDSALNLYTKSVRVQRAIYFYKYAHLIDTDAPLAGAQFVLTRETSAAIEYMTPTGGFVTSSHPDTDAAVLKVTSGDNGEVLLKGVPISAGHYIAKEVVAPNGYEITQESQDIRIVIPADADTAITLNGAKLRPLLADSVQPGEAGRTALRVYNDSAWPPLPDTFGNPPSPGTGTPPGSTPKHHGWRGFLPDTFGFLPQTGNAKTSLALIGLIMMAVALYYLKKANTLKHKEK